MVQGLTVQLLVQGLGDRGLDRIHGRRRNRLLDRGLPRNTIPLRAAHELVAGAVRGAGGSVHCE